MAQKQRSRTARWADAVGECRSALEELDTVYENLSMALNSLKDVQSEYEEWQGNLPENMQDSATGEKLQAIVDDLEIPDDLRDYNYGDLEEIISNAEGAELPLGFGRD